MQTAHAALQASDVAKPLRNTLLPHWPVIIGTALFSIGASGIMPRGNRRRRDRGTERSAAAATRPRSIRVPLSLTFLAAGVMLFIGGLARFHS